MHPLLSVRSIDDSPESFLRSIGEIFAIFDRATQDSGNLSFGVQVGGERFFVKTAGDPEDEKPFLNHRERFDRSHAISWWWRTLRFGAPSV
jgi:serine/threonine-protein kinase